MAQSLDPSLWRSLLVNFCHWKTLIHFGSVCRSWHRLIWCHTTWRALTSVTFGESYADQDCAMGECTLFSFLRWRALRAAASLHFVRALGFNRIPVHGGYVRDLLLGRLEEFYDIDIAAGCPLYMTEEHKPSENEDLRFIERQKRVIVGIATEMHLQHKEGAEPSLRLDYPDRVEHWPLIFFNEHIPPFTVDLLDTGRERNADSTASMFEILSLNFYACSSVIMVFSSWAKQDPLDQEIASYNVTSLLSSAVKNALSYIPDGFRRFQGAPPHTLPYPFRDVLQGRPCDHPVTMLLQRRVFRILSPVDTSQFFRLKRRIARWREIGLSPDPLCWTTMALVMYLDRCPEPTALESACSDTKEATQVIAAAEASIAERMVSSSKRQRCSRDVPWL